MPSPISFFPTDCAAKTGASTPAASTEAPADASASFDSVLTKAAPASGKPAPRHPVAGSARDSHAQEKRTVPDESSAESATPDRALLSAQELAAMLALMGVPSQQAPLPVVPVELDLASETAAADTEIESAADLTNASVPVAEGQEIFVPRVQQGQDKNSAPFAMPADPSRFPTSRELIQQGAEVIDYDLAADLQETPTAPMAPSPKNTVEAPSGTAPAMTAPAAKEAVLPVALTHAMTSVAPAPKKPVSSSPLPVSDGEAAPSDSVQRVSDEAGTAIAAAALVRPATAKTPPLNAATEKFAVLGVSPAAVTPSGVNSSIEANKNNFLTVDKQDLASEQPLVGTRAANWGDSMNPESRPAPFAPRSVEGVAAVDTTFSGVLPAGKTSESASTPPAQAAQIVHEIRDIADSLWAVERNSVEVRFHFNEKEHLSVKVEYRDGVVKTTFRTDSPELRDTIAREWQSQVASAADSRPYRVADPVFNTPPADARGFSLGGDSSRQQRQAEQSANAQNTFAATFGRGSSSSSSTAAAAAPALVRPDTALHLHAFA